MDLDRETDRSPSASAAEERHGKAKLLARTPEPNRLPSWRTRRGARPQPRVKPINRSRVCCDGGGERLVEKTIPVQSHLELVDDCCRNFYRGIKPWKRRQRL